jgi:phage-related protein
VISPTSIDIREVVFIGDAQDGLDRLPEEIQTEAHAALLDLQNGKRPLGDKYTELKGDLAGIGEIRIRFNTDTYRIYNVATFKEVLYVLEAGIKKSTKSGAVPLQDERRLEARHKAAKKNYKANISTYQEAYAEREARRIAYQKRMEKLLPSTSLKPKGRK